LADRPHRHAVRGAREGGPARDGGGAGHRAHRGRAGYVARRAPPAGGLAPRAGVVSALEDDRPRPLRATLRWRIAVLVSAAIAISHLDRLTLPVAIKAIEREIPVTNQQFSLLQTAFLVTYAFMYVAGGRLLDAVGTRRGFTVIMVAWSLAGAGHGLARA